MTTPRTRVTTSLWALWLMGSEWARARWRGRGTAASWSMAVPRWSLAGLGAVLLTAALVASVTPPPVAASATAACEPLTDAQLVAQVIGAPLREPAATPAALELAAEHAGTVVLLGDAITSADQVRGLIGALDAAAPPGLPPLIAVDEEGGRVARFGRSGVTTHLPSAREQARTSSPEDVRASAVGLGAEMAALGVDWDLAPVLDLTDADASGVIGDRSYGTDPATAGSYAAAFAGGLREAGLVTSGKHFPDHGLTTVDTHRAVAHVDVSLAALRDHHLVPYRVALAELDSIMLSHLRVSSLDPDLPASLSAVAVDFLREELGFDRAIVTDDLSMRAVASVADQPTAAVMALTAGADVLLLGTPQSAADAHAALLRALDDGTLSKERLRQAVRRALALKGVEGAAATCMLGLPPIGEANAVIDGDGVVSLISDGVLRAVPDPQTAGAFGLRPARYSDQEVAGLTRGSPLSTVRRFAPVVVALPGTDPLDLAVQRASVSGTGPAESAVVVVDEAPWVVLLAASLSQGRPVLPPAPADRHAAALVPVVTEGGGVDVLGGPAPDTGGRPVTTVATDDPLDASLRVLDLRTRRDGAPTGLVVADPDEPSLPLLAGWLASADVGLLLARDADSARLRDRVMSHEGPVWTLGGDGVDGATVLPLDPVRLLGELRDLAAAGTGVVAHASNADLLAVLPLLASTGAVPLPVAADGSLAEPLRIGVTAWRLPGGATEPLYTVGVDAEPLLGLGVPRVYHRPSR